MLHENYCIRPCQVQTEASHTCRQQQDIVARVCVELIHDILPFVCFDAAVQSQVLDAREQFAEDVVLNNVEHFLHLAENESAVLGDVVCFWSKFACAGIFAADTAVDKEVTESGQFGGVGDVF